MGLSIVRTIVEAHHGHIELAKGDEATNGAVFRVEVAAGLSSSPWVAYPLEVTPCLRSDVAALGQLSQSPQPRLPRLSAPLRCTPAKCRNCLAPDGGCIEVLVNLGEPASAASSFWAGLQQHPGRNKLHGENDAASMGTPIRPEGGLSKPHPQGALTRPIKLCSSAHPRMRTAELRTGSVAERLARSFSLCLRYCAVGISSQADRRERRSRSRVGGTPSEAALAGC